MKIKLSDHFSYGKLIKFTLPTIIMMIFTSIYGVVDGVFVSNFVGSDAFAAVNLIMPVVMILGSVGFMIGTGGSAIVSKTLGEGKKEKAREYFSMLIYLCIVSGVALSAIGIIFIRPIAAALGWHDRRRTACRIVHRHRRDPGRGGERHRVLAAGKRSHQSAGQHDLAGPFHGRQTKRMGGRGDTTRARNGEPQHQENL